MSITTRSRSPSGVSIRLTRPEDIPAIIDLQRRTYPDISPWRPSQIQSQLAHFPQGQLVAVQDGRLVGCASSLIVVWDEWCDEHDWNAVTASGRFNTHTTDGRTLYGAEVCVDLACRGAGIGHLLYEGRRLLCQAMNLKRIIACGRIPGYQKALSQIPELGPHPYAQRVVWGDLFDPVMSFQLREGFRYCGIIENYLPEDGESGGNATLIVWLNPEYTDRQPTCVPPAHEIDMDLARLALSGRTALGGANSSSRSRTGHKAEVV